MNILKIIFSVIMVIIVSIVTINAFYLTSAPDFNGREINIWLYRLFWLLFGANIFNDLYNKIKKKSN